jgi:hypothetical protein
VAWPAGFLACPDGGAVAWPDGGGAACPNGCAVNDASRAMQTTIADLKWVVTESSLNSAYPTFDPSVTPTTQAQRTSPIGRLTGVSLR